MMSGVELTNAFFHDLKQYNATNFRTIERADLSKDDPAVHKAFSSVVTRYFIFREHHPELSVTECNLLFFKLKIDMISRYFSEYPASNIDELRAFQLELQHYAKRVRGGSSNANTSTIEVSGVQLEAADPMPVQ